MPETRYTPEFAAEVCRRMSEGDSLRQVCRDNDIAEATVRQWARDDRQGFASQYGLIKLSNWRTATIWSRTTSGYASTP
jgi:transposase-like protein